MGHVFLSQAWFDAVSVLREEVLETLNNDMPAEINTLQMNIAVSDASGEKRFAFSGGDVSIGQLDNPDVTLYIDYPIAQRLFEEGDSGAAVQAFMAGQIRVEGDMSRLIPLQQYMNVQPSEQQLVLRQRVLDMTDFP